MTSSNLLGTMPIDLVCCLGHFLGPADKVNFLRATIEGRSNNLTIEAKQSFYGAFIDGHFKNAKDKTKQVADLLFESTYAGNPELMGALIEKSSNDSLPLKRTLRNALENDDFTLFLLSAIDTKDYERAIQIFNNLPTKIRITLLAQFYSECPPEIQKLFPQKIVNVIEHYQIERVKASTPYFIIGLFATAVAVGLIPALILTFSVVLSSLFLVLLIGSGISLSIAIVSYIAIAVKYYGINRFSNKINPNSPEQYHEQLIEHTPLLKDRKILSNSNIRL